MAATALLMQRGCLAEQRIGPLPTLRWGWAPRNAVMPEASLLCSGVTRNEALALDPLMGDGARQQHETHDWQEFCDGTTTCEVMIPLKPPT